VFVGRIEHDTVWSLIVGSHAESANEIASSSVTNHSSLDWISDRAWMHSSDSSLFALSSLLSARTLIAAAPIINTISGTVFDANGNPITTGRTIKLIQNGSLSGTTASSDALGIYTFSGLTLANGDKIVVYIGGGASEKGATVTFTGTSDINTLNIYQNQLVVRSDNGSVVTNANLKSGAGFNP
jgi:hypothetical protein